MLTCILVGKHGVMFARLVVGVGARLIEGGGVLALVLGLEVVETRPQTASRISAEIRLMGRTY